MAYQLAELNIARMRGVNMDDPIMKDFKNNLDRINDIAEGSDGFIWRLKDDNNNATAFNPFNDEKIIVNMSVWRDIESLGNFAFKSGHVEYLRRKREWFETFGSAYVVFWWIPIGMLPTLEEAVVRLNYLNTHGPTPHAFTFRNQFEPTTVIL